VLAPDGLPKKNRKFAVSNSTKENPEEHYPTKIEADTLQKTLGINIRED